MARWFAIAAICAGMLVSVSSARAEDKVDPSGTWKWSSMFNDQTRESTLKLKLDGDKLTGAVLGRENSETPIADATYADGKISFTVTRERNGNKMTSKFNGAVTADAIKGTIETAGREGKTRVRDWEAKRAE